MEHSRKRTVADLLRRSATRDSRASSVLLFVRLSRRLLSVEFRKPLQCTEFKRQFRSGPLPSRRQSIPLGTRSRRTPRARANLGLRAEDVCVLLLGTVCERKGQHDLLRAFASLPAGIAVRTTCLVVGSRDKLAYSRKLTEMARSLPEDRRHRFRVIPETGDTGKFCARRMCSAVRHASKATRM